MNHPQMKPGGNLKRWLVLLLIAAVATSVRGAVHYADSPDTIVDTRSAGLAPPAGLTASRDTYIEFVELAWSPVPGATGYRVFRGEVNSAAQAQAIALNVATTRYEDTTANPAQNYYYWVRSLQDGTVSGFSAMAVGRRRDPRPPMPGNLVATQGTFGDRIRLTWSPVGAATRYEVYRAARSVREIAQALSTQVTISEYNDLAPVGWTFFYWLAAANAQGTSDWAGPVRGRAGNSVTWWGSDALERMPESYADALQIELGRRHGVALLPGGSVGVWGDNFYGQRSMPGVLVGITAVAAGFDHSLALTRDGRVIGWGADSRGQSTQGNALRGAIAIAAGGEFSMGLLMNGTVAVWGDDRFGLQQVPATASDVVMIAAGGQHALALRADGTVVGWGNNDRGQAAVPAGLSGVQAVAAGFDFSLALLDDGTVRGWGNNDRGQAPAYYAADAYVTHGGRGALRPQPMAGPSNVVSISAGFFHSLFVLANGSVVTAGQTTAPPTENTVIAKVAAGDGFSAGLRREGLPASVSLFPADPYAPQGSRVVMRGTGLATGRLDYQWFHNGRLLEGETRAYLLIEAVSAATVGSYQVEVYNGVGRLKSNPSVLSIGGNPTLVEYFAGYEVAAGGWSRAEGFGNLYAEGFPYVFTPEHGWLWLSPNRYGDGYHFHHPIYGWSWTRPDIFPWFCSIEENGTWYR
jgi:hypothetical protein